MILQVVTEPGNRRAEYEYSDTAFTDRDPQMSEVIFRMSVKGVRIDHINGVVTEYIKMPDAPEPSEEYWDALMDAAPAEDVDWENTYPWKPLELKKGEMDD